MPRSLAAHAAESGSLLRNKAEWQKVLGELAAIAHDFGCEPHESPHHAPHPVFEREPFSAG